MDADTYSILVAQQQILRGLLQASHSANRHVLLAQLDALDAQLAEHWKWYDPIKCRKGE